MKRFLAITAAIAFLFLASTEAQVQKLLDVQQALGLVGTLNEIQLVIATNTKSYGSQTDMLIGERGLKSHLGAYSSMFEWAKQVNLSSSEILPGWTLDFALVGKGYRLILTGKDDTLVTDETGVIYRAATAQRAPTAAQLKGAKDFPGAIAHDLWEKQKQQH